jgi:hypothetical protein
LYDSAVGRFPSVDPLADQFAWVSPFNYAENDPVQYVDLWGLQQGSKPEFMPIEKPSHLITRTPWNIYMGFKTMIFEDVYYANKGHKSWGK